MKILDRFITASQKMAVSASVAEATMPRWQRRAQAIVPLLLVAAVVGMPAIAHAQATPWETTAEKTYDLIMSIVRWVAMIAVVGCGLAALFGKLSWDWAGKIIIGLVLIFGGTYLVDYFANGMN